MTATTVDPAEFVHFAGTSKLNDSDDATAATAWAGERKDSLAGGLESESE